MGDHLLGCDADGFGDVVRDVEVGWPDGSDALRECGRTGVCLDGVPEERGYEAYHDSEAREVPAERGAHGYWERDV